MVTKTISVTLLLYLVLGLALSACKQWRTEQANRLLKSVSNMLTHVLIFASGILKLLTHLRLHGSHLVATSSAHVSFFQLSENSTLNYHSFISKCVNKNAN